MVVATLRQFSAPTQAAAVRTETDVAQCPSAADPAPTQSPAPSMVRKAFDILNAFSVKERTLSVREIARRCDLPKSTTHRLVTELVELGAISRTEEGYQVGTGMFQLGMLSMAQLPESCAQMAPPALATARQPRVPSSPMPLKMMAPQSGPKRAAASSINASIDGW